MSTNDSIEDALTRHQIFLQRYAKGREVQAERFIVKIIREAETKLGLNFDSLSKARQDIIIGEIIDRIRTANNRYTEIVIEEMLDFIEYELDFNYKVLTVNIQAPTVLPAVEQVQRSLLSRVMQLEPTKGYTIRQALQEFGSRKAMQIIQTIRDGITLGQTTPQIVNQMRNVAEIQKRQASTLARTIINHASIQARQVTMRENNDIIDRYKWLATLDSRTSLICASRDGKIYEDKDENPKPPAHFNCRSTITFIVKDEFDLGLDVVGKRGAVGAEGAGQVRGDTYYEQWLRRQPFSFQVEVLGQARAKLFRDGNLSIGRFVDSSGRTLSLDQLRQMEPLIFESLGI